MNKEMFSYYWMCFKKEVKFPRGWLGKTFLIQHDKVFPWLVSALIYLQHSDVGGEDGVDGLLDVDVLLLHLIGVLTDRPAVVWEEEEMQREKEVTGCPKGKSRSLSVCFHCKVTLLYRTEALRGKGRRFGDTCF